MKAFAISFNSSENDRKIVEEITTHISYLVIFLPENRAPYEIMWENMVQLDGPLITI
jgi:hypothetical protein